MGTQKLISIKKGGQDTGIRLKKKNKTKKSPIDQKKKPQHVEFEKKVIYAFY